MLTEKQARRILFRWMTQTEPLPTDEEVSQAQEYLLTNRPFQTSLSSLADTVITPVDERSGELWADQLFEYVEAQINENSDDPKFDYVRQRLDMSVADTEEYFVLYESLQHLYEQQIAATPTPKSVQNMKESPTAVERIFDTLSTVSRMLFGSGPRLATSAIAIVAVLAVSTYMLRQPRQISTAPSTDFFAIKTETEPNDNCQTADGFAFNQPIQGTIASQDIDVYMFTLLPRTPGQEENLQITIQPTDEQNTDLSKLDAAVFYVCEENNLTQELNLPRVDTTDGAIQLTMPLLDDIDSYDRAFIQLVTDSEQELAYQIEISIEE